MNRSPARPFHATFVLALAMFALEGKHNQSVPRRVRRGEPPRPVILDTARRPRICDGSKVRHPYA